VVGAQESGLALALVQGPVAVQTQLHPHTGVPSLSVAQTQAQVQKLASGLKLERMQMVKVLASGSLTVAPACSCVRKAIVSFAGDLSHMTLKLLAR
jgi:hypothetical protein